MKNKNCNIFERWGCQLGCCSDIVKPQSIPTPGQLERQNEAEAKEASCRHHRRSLLLTQGSRLTGYCSPVLSFLGMFLHLFLLLFRHSVLWLISNLVYGGNFR